MKSFAANPSEWFCKRCKEVDARYAGRVKEIMAEAYARGVKDGSFQCEHEHLRAEMCWQPKATVRAEALEEAAKWCETRCLDGDDCAYRECARGIRALKDKVVEINQ